MRVLYQATPEATFEVYRCRLSGREEFDLTEGAHKARRLVRDGHAVEAIVLNDGQIAAQWQRQGTEIIQLSGPDL